MARLTRQFCAVQTRVTIGLRMKSAALNALGTAALVCSGIVLPAAPAAAEPINAAAPPQTAVILTPKPARSPRINGPAVYGIRPGTPFWYTIPVTGDRPMLYGTKGLPAGLHLDPESGRITGTLKNAGRFAVTLTAENALGHAERSFTIRCGPAIGLTPALGWNSWNAFGSAISDVLARAAADAMVKQTPYGRLIDHGWSYINLDDGWQRSPREGTELYEGPTRDSATGKILPNKKFPDMKALGDYIHSLGLKFGIYSSPGPLTCQNLEGSYEHEQLDAQTWADWGVDYLKYDWCSYGRIASRLARAWLGTNAPPEGANAEGDQHRRGPRRVPLSREDFVKPYREMGEILAQSPRSILFSLCQYGQDNVWDWAPAIGGNSWRTTADIADTWKSLSGIGFAQGGHPEDISPGHFDDPDMLIVGRMGLWSGEVRPSRLTPDEQYTHISLWCLLNAPLLLGCDMSQLDEFTLNLLCNDEVLAVDQDSLCRQAKRVAQTDSTQVWAKEMEDGSKVVGLFNVGDGSGPVTANWSDIGITGKHSVRDLWRQKDVGEFNNAFTADVPQHGVVLVRITSKTSRNHPDME